MLSSLPSTSSPIFMPRDLHHPHLYRQPCYQGHTRQRHVLCCFKFSVVLLDQILGDLNRRRLQGRTCNEFQRGISTQFSRQPQKGFFKVVVALCWDIKVLEILFAVECDGFGFDFAVFDIDFISTKDNGNAFADSDKITCWLEKRGKERTMPIWNIFIRNARRNIKHDDATLTYP